MFKVTSAHDEEGEVSAPAEDDLLIRGALFSMVESLKSNVGILSGKILLFSFSSRDFKNYDVALDYIFRTLFLEQTTSSQIVFLVSLSKAICEDECDGEKFKTNLTLRAGQFMENIGRFRQAGIQNFVLFISLLKTNHSISLSWAK